MPEKSDEHLQNLYELYFSKKLTKEEIHSYPFGNGNFRGHPFGHADKNVKTIYYLLLLKRFRKVSLILNLQYSNNDELEGIKQELSELNRNE